MEKRQKKIIVAVDGSPASQAALQVGIEFAALHGSEVLLLHAVEPVSNILEFFAERELNAERRKHANGLLDKLLAELGPTDVQISKAIGVGKPYKVILDMSEEILAEMIVLGSWGTHAAGSGMVGSNVHKVVRMARCPVVTVPQKAGSNIFSRVLIPVDPNFGLGELEQLLYKYRKTFNPTVELMTVVPKLEDSDSEREYLEKHRNRLVEAGIKDVVVHVVEGKNPSKALLEFAFGNGHNMVWMETHGRSGLANFIFGSVTEEVMSAGLFTILSLHPEREPSRAYYYHSNLPI